jgi:hypothetical protein
MEEVNDCMKTYTHPSRATSSLAINQYPKISDNHVHHSNSYVYEDTGTTFLSSPWYQSTHMYTFA